MCKPFWPLRTCAYVLESLHRRLIRHARVTASTARAESRNLSPRGLSHKLLCRFGGDPPGGDGASRSLTAVGGVQGFFSEYSLFLIVLFAAIIVVFVSIILALGVYICKVQYRAPLKCCS